MHGFTPRAPGHAWQSAGVSDDTTDRNMLARFDDSIRESGEHLWNTLGYRRVSWGEGATQVAWDATPEYGFPTASGHICKERTSCLASERFVGSKWQRLDGSCAATSRRLACGFLAA